MLGVDRPRTDLHKLKWKKKLAVVDVDCLTFASDVDFSRFVHCNECCANF